MVSLAVTENNRIKSLERKQIKSSFNTNNIKSLSGNDIFEKIANKNEVSFKGRQYPSGHYSDDEITTAKKYINESGISWHDKLYNQKLSQLNKEISTFGKEGIDAISQVSDSKSHPILGKVAEYSLAAVYGLAFGASHLAEKAIKESGNKTQAENYKKRIVNLRNDLKNERLNEGNEASEISTAESKIKEDYLRQKCLIQEESLKPKLLDLIQSAKEGKVVSVPNGVMLVGQSSDATNDLIEWSGKNINGRFVQVDYKDNILQHLKKAEEAHKETGSRTLLHIRNFDNLLNPSITPEHVIADLKNIMAKASDKYHSTIIFSTQDPTKLNSITLQTHRIEERIDVGFEHPDETIPRLAWDRVTKSRAATHPVATINDLLKYKKFKNIPQLAIDHSSFELERAVTTLRNVSSDYAKEALEIAVGRLR